MNRARTRCGWRATAAMLIASILTAASVAQQGDREAWRKSPPRPGPSRPLTLPESHEIKLPNGLTVILVEDHRAPLVTIDAGINLNLATRNNLDALTNEVTLAEATAELLTEGAGSRSSRQIAQDVESLGGRIASSATDDYIEASAEVISENAESMIDIFADVLARPSFPAEEVALYKSNRIDKLQADRQDPAYLAAERFNRVVFGLSPYAITSPTSRAVKALSRLSIRRFYDSKCSPADSVVVVVGDFDRRRMESSVRRALGQWRAKATRFRTAKPAPARSKRRHVYLVDRPGSEQADVRIGRTAVARTSKDFFPLMVATALLGGGTNSRLFLNIREKRGYAYDVYSQLKALKRSGAFYVASQNRTEVAVAAIREMLAELERLRDDLVPAEELVATKNYLAGLFSLSLASQEGIADRLTQIKVIGLEPDYLPKYRARIESVTPEQIRSVARKYIASGREAVVVVGDAKTLAPALRSIGPVQVYSSRRSAR